MRRSGAGSRGRNRRVRGRGGHGGRRNRSRRRRRNHPGAARPATAFSAWTSTATCPGMAPAWGSAVAWHLAEGYAGPVHHGRQQGDPGPASSLACRVAFRWRGGRNSLSEGTGFSHASCGILVPLDTEECRRGLAAAALAFLRMIQAVLVEEEPPAAAWDIGAAPVASQEDPGAGKAGCRAGEACPVPRLRRCTPAWLARRLRHPLVRAAWVPNPRTWAPASALGQ